MRRRGQKGGITRSNREIPMFSTGGILVLIGPQARVRCVFAGLSEKLSFGDYTRLALPPPYQADPVQYYPKCTASLSGSKKRWDPAPGATAPGAGFWGVI
jgi:hypothetical protein